jgi:hypothetical protein
MMQMDRVTQTNSSQTEELSATAASLASQSSHLEAMVSKFTLTGGAHQIEVEAALPPVAEEKQGAVQTLENLSRNLGRSGFAKSHEEEFEEF